MLIKVVKFGRKFDWQAPNSLKKSVRSSEKIPADVM